MGYDTAAKTDAKSAIPEEWGGMWFLRGALDTDKLGFTILELEPDGMGKEHDESESGQEEIYYVVEGSVTVELGDQEASLEEDEAIRLDPEQTRKIVNDGDVRAKLVLAGGPI